MSQADAASQTVSRYAALLADHNFNFTPYFDEAVCGWLRNNLKLLLEEQPEACKYFIRDDSHLGDVASSIPLTPEYSRYLDEFLLFLEKSQSSYQFSTIANRMVEAGMADTMWEIAPKLSRGTSIVINALSEVNFNQYVESTTPASWNSNIGDPVVFFKRVPKNQIKRFILPLDQYRGIYGSSDRARVVSALAQTVPFEELNLLKVYWDHHKYGKEFFCMSCGNKELKSRPGYSLHRNKGCDPKGHYPNLTEIIGKRLYDKA
jgi:hypothetical protein